MSSEDYSYVEQDTNDSTNQGGLPTYDDLAAQNGPNSRSVLCVEFIEIVDLRIHR